MTCFKKRCNKCKKEKPFEDFNKDKSRKDGLSYRCKSCQKTLHSNHYKKNTKERCLQNKEWYEKNKDQRLKKCAEYYQNNKDKKNEYQKMRRKTHPQSKIAERLRGRIWQALKGNAKTHNTIQLLGCSVEDLKTYLENNFKNGMNWENYGTDGWHIDHIKPCALFNLTKEQDQLLCFNYTNLQPLWAKDNLQKGKKF
jgi:hypothetical protein